MLKSDKRFFKFRPLSAAKHPVVDEFFRFQFAEGCFCILNETAWTLQNELTNYGPELLQPW